MPFFLFLCLSHCGIACLADEHNTALCVVKERKRGYHPPISLNANTYMDLIRQSSIFVDKSLLIKQLVEHPSRSFLVCRPKRWGKSINLDMIRMFVDMEADKEGNEIPINDKMANYRLFTKGEFASQNNHTGKLKTPLLVSQHKSIVDNYLGKYPVVYINFTNIQGETVYNIVGEMLSRISEAFKKHQYMLPILRGVHKQDGICDTDRVHIGRDIEKFFYILNKTRLPDRQYIHGSLKMLCKLLFQHFKTRVFLFVDDYDAPITAVLTSNSLNPRQEHDFQKFYTNFLITSLVHNDYLEKGVVTGVLHLWKEFANISLDHIQQDHLFFSQQFTEFFGMNSWETNIILEHYEVPKRAIDDINAFYCGYAFSGFPLQVCNPWSIAKVLANKNLKPTAWLTENRLEWKTINRLFTNLSPNSKFRIRFLPPFTKNYDPINTKISLESSQLEWRILALFHKASVAIYDRLQFKEMSSRRNTTALLADLGITFLLQQGFFTVEHRLPMEKFFHIRIPTQEVREFLKDACPLAYDNR